MSQLKVEPPLKTSKPSYSSATWTKSNLSSTAKVIEWMSTHDITANTNVVNQVSILPTDYVQLLRGQIPKAKKDRVKSSSFFALLGSVCIKAACKHVDEIDPRKT